MTDHASFKVGAFAAPLTASTARALLADADPALACALAFWAAVLQTHLGARWDAEVIKAGLPTLAGKLAALPIPADPLPFLTSAGLAPPFLAAFVVSEETEERTRHYYTVSSEWKLQLVLPPLTLSQYLQLSPILRAASKVIVDRTELGRDPAYQAGAAFTAAGGIERISIRRTAYGNIPGAASNVFFPTLDMDISVNERRMDVPSDTPLVSLTGAVSVDDEAGPVSAVAFSIPLAL